MFSMAALSFERPKGQLSHHLIEYLTPPALAAINPTFRTPQQILEGSPEAIRYHARQIYQLFTEAAKSGIKTLILGAYGSGVYNNDPNLMACIFAWVINIHPNVKDIDQIIFTIPYDLKSRNATNFQTYQRVFSCQRTSSTTPTSPSTPISSSSPPEPSPAPSFGTPPAPTFSSPSPPPQFGSSPAPGEPSPSSPFATPPGPPSAFPPDVGLSQEDIARQQALLNYYKGIKKT
jgi:hypothetical protein